MAEDPGEFTGGFVYDRTMSWVVHGIGSVDTVDVFGSSVPFMTL